ncbi:hypothetical protein VNO77_18111 [Canavalia gladiata]|uniref:INO80 complex subunit B-like conserved region domain-containing protein n=1 Tax=Canavalia gladiata TaxID=3824 RepID=A0AAN9LKC2_CANGL
MAFNKSLFLIVSISSLFLFTYPMASFANVAPQQVAEFCSGTENATLCADTITPYFQGSFDPLLALAAEIEATLKQSLKISNIIVESLGNPTTDKRALDALDICKTQFESIADDIKKAGVLLTQQNVVDASYKFNAVLSYRSACEEAFVESPGVISPIAQDSLTLFQLGGNCLAIMNNTTQALAPTTLSPLIPPPWLRAGANNNVGKAFVPTESVLSYNNKSLMEDLSSTRFDGLSSTVRRKRSQTSRRPRPDSQPVSEGQDLSPLSSTPPSEDAGKVSSDENAGYDTNSKRKEFNLNHCVSQTSSATGAEDDKSHKSKKDGGFRAFYNNEPGRSGLHNKRCSEGVLAPANWKGSIKVKDSLDSESRNADLYGGRNPESLNLGQFGGSQDGSGSENRVKKVKLKVGGVTRTIQANSASNGASGSGSTSKSSRSSDASRPRQKPQSNSDDNNSPSDKRSGLQGVPWKDFSRGGFGLGKEELSMGKISGKNASSKLGDKSEPVRKSKRVPKRRVLDGEFGDDDDEDDEIRYLEKLKTSKVSAVYRDEEELGKKHRKLSSVSNMENAALSRSGKDSKKRSRSDRMYEDTDYEDEEDSGSDGELEDKKKKKQRKESVDVLMDSKREITLTTRQRALQSSKDASASGASLIEFPNGLPPAPPRKQKEKLSEVEQQLKKAEAAQRRRMQVEKAARESEAEAIRKILGQDSSRKKREEKMKKRQEELAQEKAANARMLASNTIRYVMGPTGTVVTFPEEMGFPSVLNFKPVSYPPPREKCAGPSCTNPYKYRDSKLKLPLCSLQCYKAVQEKMATETTTC